MNCIAGIDPGITGGVAFYFPSRPERIAAYDMPNVDGRVNATELSMLIEQFKPDGVVIELVGAVRGNGLTSMFNFGRAFGTAIGVVSAQKIPVHFPTPTKWKKHFTLSTDKEESRRRAVERWPACADSFSRRKDHNRAEAAFLALYGAEVAFRFVGDPVDA
jgi:crossover junction endodeoxyribonuclease RuvC